jgi:hypothetical protein
MFLIRLQDRVWWQIWCTVGPGGQVSPLLGTPREGGKARVTER